MTKVEVGVVVTVVLALLSGALYIGRIDGRLSAIELDKDLKSIHDARVAAVAEIEESKSELLQRFDSLNTKVVAIEQSVVALKSAQSEKASNKALESEVGSIKFAFQRDVETTSNRLNARMVLLEQSTTDLASGQDAKADRELLIREISTLRTQLQQEIKSKIIASFSNFELGEAKNVGGAKCPDGTVVVQVPHQVDPGGRRGYVARMQPSCAPLKVKF